VLAQTPPTEWARTYGAEDYDSARSVVQTSDGGYALAGRGFATLVKTDPEGNQQWNKSYGGGASSVVQTSDGGYAIAGGFSDFWLVKTDNTGNMQWNQTYGGSDDEQACSVVQTDDGGYAIAGTTKSFGAGWTNFWLVKTDAAGNMEWNKTYGGTTDNYCHFMVQTNDEGYALAGYTGYAIPGSTQSSGAGATDFWLVKTDAAGNMEWNKTYGGSWHDRAYSLVQTSDQGYAIAGWTASFGAGGFDFWLVKTDIFGNMEWNKAYGGGGSEECMSLVQTDDEGYALVGYTLNEDFWLVKTDSTGNMQWNQTYGGSDDERAYSVVQTDDGGYAIAGTTTSFGAGRSDFWLVKLACKPPQPVGGTSLSLEAHRLLPWAAATILIVALAVAAPMIRARRDLDGA